MTDVKDEKTRRTALITGASGGIGEELARAFAAGGHDVLLVARSAERLNGLAAQLSSTSGVTARSLALDLTDAAAPDALHAWTRQLGTRVDILVNNAGFGLQGPFAELDTRRQMEMISLNVAALTHLTRLFLPPMIERRWGRVLNVASTAAFVPGPLMAVYYASKAYVLSFSAGLAGELSGSGVSVTVLCPGATQTSFASVAGSEGSNLFKGGGVMAAAPVARAGYAATMAGKRVVIPGWRNRLLVASGTFAPTWAKTAIARRLNSRAT
jgi:short-subunit dehydrogenase